MCFYFTQEPGRRISVAASKRGSIVGRRERTASVRSTASQSTLAESISGRLSHAGSVTSVFRRMFSRDKTSELNSPTEGKPTYLLEFFLIPINRLFLLLIFHQNFKYLVFKNYCFENMKPFLAGCFSKYFISISEP